MLIRLLSGSTVGINIRDRLVQSVQGEAIENVVRYSTVLRLYGER